jgi:phenylpropionate dioxygenase-like ring-hydroxylating dioxygenase large terminal subunit
VKQGKVRAVNSAGAPHVRVRGRDARVFALENRRAPRQVPLHLWEVREDGIKCGYHGWTSNAERRCISIPYLDQCATRPNSIRAYPCREAYGLVFVLPGDRTRADRTALPDVPSVSNPAYKTRSLNHRVHCHCTLMHENLGNMNHQFLHRRLMDGIRTAFPGVRSGKNWIEAD